jgi:hypothetical protein
MKNSWMQITAGADKNQRSRMGDGVGVPKDPGDEDRLEDQPAQFRN